MKSPRLFYTPPTPRARSHDPYVPLGLGNSSKVTTNSYPNDDQSEKFMFHEQKVTCKKQRLAVKELVPSLGSRLTVGLHTLSAISSHETFIPGSAIEWHCNHLCEGNVEESSRPAGYLLDMPRAGGCKRIDNRSINPHPCWRSITQGMISLQIFSGSPAPPPLCQQAWTWKYVTSAADMPHTLRSSSTKGLKR